jgi:hypothetical protein
MKPSRYRLIGITVTMLFAITCVLLPGPGAWAAGVPTVAQWKALKSEHGIANSKHNMGKALKNYNKFANAALRTSEDRGSDKWAKQYKSAAKASGKLDKTVTAYRKDMKKKYPDKKAFLAELKEIQRKASNNIILFNNMLSKYGGADRKDVAYALKAYIKKFKKSSKKMDGNSTKDAVKALYTGPYRGVGTVMPEVKKHYDEYAKVVKKWNKAFDRATKLTNSSNFDAEKAVYAMKVSVEYVEQSMSAVLK